MNAIVNKVLVACLSAGLLTGMAACGNTSHQGAVNADAPQQGGTLKVIQVPDPVGCIDPFQAYWTGTRTIVRQFAESLTDQDPKTGEIKPWLASGWRQSEDGKTLTVDLKHGITFSDGEPFNADAVVKNFTTDLQTAKEIPGTYGQLYTQNLEEVQKVDDDTVNFVFSAPNASFLQGLSTTNLAVISPKSLELPPEERCTAALSGTGAFVLKKFNPKTAAQLIRRKGHTWSSPFQSQKGDAYLDGIEFSYSGENSVRVGSLSSGSVDVLWPDSDHALTQNDKAQIEQAGGRVESRSLPGTAYNLFPNIRYGRPLNDINVRKAVTLGIDRATYAATLLRDDYPVVSGFLDSTTTGMLKTPANTTYDPKKAGELLDESGWKLKDDGYRYKDGKRLTLHLLTFTKNEGHELIQDQLKKIGIDYRIDVTTAAEENARMISGDYDFLGDTFTRNDLSVLNRVLDLRYSSWKDETRNIATEEQHAQLAQLFDRGTYELDPVKCRETYRQVQQFLSDNYILIPVYERLQDYAASSRVQGIRFTAEAFGDFSGAWIAK